MGALEVMGLSWRKEKSRRIAQCIDRGMHLGAQAVSAASEGLLIRTPPFRSEERRVGKECRSVWWPFH